jgi:hypothetical protein
MRMFSENIKIILERKGNISSSQKATQEVHKKINTRVGRRDHLLDSD